jgi:hypothetical protein
LTLKRHWGAGSQFLKGGWPWPIRALEQKSQVRHLLEGMTEEDITQAEQMVQNWEPGQCPKPN